MGDTLKKVQAGQRLETPAETYNAFLDAVRAERARRHSIEQDAGGEFRQTGIVKVRNNTGARERFDILGLDTPIVDPGVNLPERILFVGAHCDDIELIAGGLLARACFAGRRVGVLVFSDHRGVLDEVAAARAHGEFCDNMSWLRAE